MSAGAQRTGTPRSPSGPTDPRWPDSSSRRLPWPPTGARSTSSRDPATHGCWRKRAARTASSWTPGCTSTARSPLEPEPGPQATSRPGSTVGGLWLSWPMEIEALLREAEVHKLRIAYQWAIAHPALDACETPSGPALPSVLTAPETLGGAGTPAVAAFTPEPLAVALGCSPASASTLLADALDLHHRLPLLWDQAQAQTVPVWKARRVATRTRHLSFDAARWVDRQLAGRASRLSAAALDRVVAEAAARCDGKDQADREALARQRRHPRPDAIPRRRLCGGRGPRRAGRHRRPRRPQGQGARGDR